MQRLAGAFETPEIGYRAFHVFPGRLVCVAALAEHGDVAASQT
jgi:hypothetical protein